MEQGGDMCLTRAGPGNRGVGRRCCGRPPPPASPTQGRRAPAQAFPPKQLETPGSAGQAQLV